MQNQATAPTRHASDVRPNGTARMRALVSWTPVGLRRARSRKGSTLEHTTDVVQMLYKVMSFFLVSLPCALTETCFSSEVLFVGSVGFSNESQSVKHKVLSAETEVRCRESRFHRDRRTGKLVRLSREAVFHQVGPRVFCIEQIKVFFRCGAAPLRDRDSSRHTDKTGVMHIAFLQATFHGGTSLRDHRHSTTLPQPTHTVLGEKNVRKTFNFTNALFFFFSYFKKGL